MAKTVPAGYRDFMNTATAGIESSMRATWEVLVAKSEDDGIYYGRWNYVEIYNAGDLASDTFKGIDNVTGEEKYYDSLAPIGILMPDATVKPGFFTEIKIPAGSTLKIIAYK